MKDRAGPRAGVPIRIPRCQSELIDSVFFGHLVPTAPPPSRWASRKQDSLKVSEVHPEKLRAVQSAGQGREQVPIPVWGTWPRMPQGCVTPV